MGNYRPFLQGPLPVANYTRIIIPGRFWTRPPSTKSTRMASSATPLHDSLIELAIPDAHAHAIKWYLKLRNLTQPNRCSHQLELQVPFARTNSYFYSFVPHTSSLWNSLPKDIINLSTSYHSFKYHLRSQ